MDVAAKGGSLLLTQLCSVARMLLDLPACAWAALGPPEDEPGCTFYEGVVTHCRKRPVANSFE